MNFRMDGRLPRLSQLRLADVDEQVASQWSRTAPHFQKFIMRLRLPVGLGDQVQDVFKR